MAQSRWSMFNYPLQNPKFAVSCVALIGKPWPLFEHHGIMEMQLKAWRKIIVEATFHHNFTSGHTNDVIMSTMASQTTSLTIVYSTVYSGANHIIHQSSASLAFVRGIHQWPVNSPHKGPVKRKMFPFGDVIMYLIDSNNGKCNGKIVPL